MNKLHHAALFKGHWETGARLERNITIDAEGLKLGTVTLAKYDAQHCLKLNEQHILALLQVAYGYVFPNIIIHKIRCAERALKQHGVAMMHMHFALAGLNALETMQQVQNLFIADHMLRSGVSLQKMLSAFKHNPYHVPAGSSDGGQFTTAERAGGVISDPNLPQSANNPGGFVDNDSVDSDFVTDAISGAIGLVGAAAVGVSSAILDGVEAIGSEVLGVSEGAAEVKNIAETEISTTAHGSARMLERTISESEINEAITSAKEAGEVISKIGKYGAKQNIYKGKNKITVIQESSGRNAGKIITLWRNK